MINKSIDNPFKVPNTTLLSLKSVPWPELLAQTPAQTYGHTEDTLSDLHKK